MSRLFKVSLYVCIVAIALAAVMALPEDTEMKVLKDVAMVDVTKVNPTEVVRGKRHGLLGALAVGAIAGVVGYGIGAQSHYGGFYPPPVYGGYGGYGGYPPYGGFYGRK